MSSYGHDDEIWLVERILKARQERRHSLTDKCTIRSDRMQPETDNNECLRVHFVTEHGRVVRIVVIQYEAYVDGEWRAIVRYDEEHGYYHRDVVSPYGGQTKVAQPAADMNAALADAIADIRKNWREYRRTYEVAYYGKTQSR
jgi:hypothetical protein